MTSWAIAHGVVFVYALRVLTLTGECAIISKDEIYTKENTKMKKLVATLLLLAMTLTMTACGALDISKIEGEWTLSTIGGVSIEEYAEAIGASVTDCYVNWTVSDDNVLSINSVVSSSFDISIKSNGFEIMKDSSIVMSVVYKDDTLTYSVDYGNGLVEHVLVRGTNVLPTAEDGTQDAASAEV